jgi:hypothetical protein
MVERRLEREKDPGMEVNEFLKLRTAFIRRHYDVGASPFWEIIRKVEAEEEPYEPPYSEDGGEPAFMSEWTDARTSLDILGASCVSMLSDTLKLYFMTWERQLGIECQKHLPKEFKKGFVNGYEACYGQLLKTDWSDCPADWDIIEQVVLPRNDANHAKSINDMRLERSLNVREKHPLPFFLSEDERRVLETDQAEDYAGFSPSLVVTRDNLLAAIEQVGGRAAWMEDQMFEVKYGHR